MPRYFFSCEGAQAFRDTEGTELPDLRTARLQAIRNAAEVLEDNAEAFVQMTRWRVRVKDEAGLTVFALNLDIDEGGVGPAP